MNGADDRISELTALLLRLAAGEYEARGEPSARNDEVDALTLGLNLLAETLEDERQGREEAEALLRDERHAYEHAPAMFCSIHAQTLELIKCNATFANRIGLEKSDLLGRSLLDFLPAEEQPRLRAALAAIQPEQEAGCGDIVISATADEFRSVSVSASRVTVPGGPGRFRLVLRDVTEERSLEAQLRQAQKLEAVGRLASGVAHDFNNLLTVIGGAASALRELHEEPGESAADVALIIEGADRAAGLTRQLLAFGRPDIARPHVRDLNELVLESRRMIERTLGGKAKLELDLGSSPLLVCVDATHMVQVLLNLTFNARDALSQGGTLTIKTTESAEDGGRAVLWAIDDGQGMSADVLEHALEPFFSTKDTSKGSGLGLSVCYGIVHQAEGTLELSSRPGQGTSVRVALPLVTAHPEPAPQKPAAPQEAGRGERILVVDDTTGVRDLMKRTLVKAGYSVVAADGGAAALETMGQPVAMLVTDVVMPAMSGPELAAELWREHGDLPVLFVSGYTGDELGADVLERPNVRFLQKPFATGRFTELVAELLATRGRAGGRS